MAKNITLKIDDNEVNVAEGTNLIDAAEKVGVHIPNLCYLKGMKGIGACRMCLVEVEGLKAPMIGCTTKAKDGMVVNTKTEQVEEVRKFVIDLILSMHPLDCMTCTKAGVCNLQQYSYDFEIKESNFTRKKFGYPIDEANPFIKRDPDYCVLCARCVRVCKEQGTNVLDFMGRGVGSKVTTAKDNPLNESDCTFCGSCVDACPVNALLETDRWRKGREWEYEKTDSVCLACGSACDIVTCSKDGTVSRINAGAEEGSVEKYICAIGRFGFESMTSDARVAAPMKRVNGTLQETTWEDALAIVSSKLKEAGSKAGIISTAGILNQDAFVLSKLASDVIKTKNVDTTVSLYADTDSMKSSDSVTMDDVDIIVLAGLNPSQWDRILPALDASIRRRVARGAKLIYINNQPPATTLSNCGFAPIAAVNIQDNEAASIAQIAKSLITKGKKAGKDLESAVADLEVTDQIDKAASLIAEAKNPVIFCAPSLFNASRNLSLLLNIKVVAVPFEANARGVVSMGLVTGGKTYSEMAEGGVDLLYATGEVPIAKKPDVNFLITQTSYLSTLAKEADIVLPASTNLESKGSIMSFTGKMKELNKATNPIGSSKQHKDIFIELSKLLGSPIKESTSDIKAAFEVSAKPVFSAFEKMQGIDANPAEIIESLNVNITNHSKLLWFKEAEEAVAK